MLKEFLLLEHMLMILGTNVVDGQSLGQEVVVELRLVSGYLANIPNRIIISNKLISKLK